MVCKQLDNGVEKRLTVMKPLVSKWAIDMYQYFLANPNLRINGFKAAGIFDTPLVMFNIVLHVDVDNHSALLCLNYLINDPFVS